MGYYFFTTKLMGESLSSKMGLFILPVHYEIWVVHVDGCVGSLAWGVEKIRRDIGLWQACSSLVWFLGNRRVSFAYLCFAANSFGAAWCCVTKFTMDEGAWNWSLFENFLLHHLLFKIIVIKPPKGNDEDDQYQAYSKSGVFTVKSAYQALLGNMLHN